MKKDRIRQNAGWFLSLLLIGSLLMTGCAAKSENKGDDKLAENIVITETGEILEKEPQPIATPEPQPSPTPQLIDAELVNEPQQEQHITEEDQTQPTESELQLVFLGDSILDNHRDVTGIPYLTSVACNADVYNLSIGGTSATIEDGENPGDDQWTSRSLVGVVKAMLGVVSTDAFEGTRTKELLDNQEIDYSKTDYFIVEYGLNDFFRGVRQNDPDSDYNIFTYAGALRYAVDNLRGVAPDATIILCSPNYAQFYGKDNAFIGDGNSLNTGNGTLFDYKGTCEYVAGEKQVEFFDAYIDLGINGYTAAEYLEDGVHLTEKGRQLYADAMVNRILKIEEQKNN